MWTFHKSVNCEMINSVNDNTPDSKTPSEYLKGRGKPFAGALSTILVKIRGEEDQECLPEVSQGQWLRIIIYIVNFIIASNNLFPCLISTLATDISSLNNNHTICSNRGSR